MPTYEYVCTRCGQHVEVFQRISEDPLTTCGACGGQLRKVFHPAGIVFKGAGFYATDSRSKPKTKTSDGGSTGAKDGSSQSGGSSSESSGSSDTGGGSSRGEGGSSGSRGGAGGSSRGEAGSRGGSDSSGAGEPASTAGETSS